MSPEISRAMPHRLMRTGPTMAWTVRSRRPAARMMPRKMTAQAAWSKESDLKAWLEGCRLNASRGIRARVGDARTALTSLGVHLEPALANLERLVVTGGR